MYPPGRQKFGLSRSEVVPETKYQSQYDASRKEESSLRMISQTRTHASAAHFPGQNG